MWADILLSITMSVSEAIGCSYIEKKKKGKMLKEFILNYICLFDYLFISS